MQCIFRPFAFQELNFAGTYFGDCRELAVENNQIVFSGLPYPLPNQTIPCRTNAIIKDKISEIKL